MRVLITSDNAYPFIGGVEVHVRQISQEMAARQHSVTVAAANFHPPNLPRRMIMLYTNLLAKSHASFDDGAVSVVSLTPTLAQRAVMLPIAVRTLPLASRLAHHTMLRWGYEFYRRAHLPRLRELAQNADVLHTSAHGYLGWASLEAAHGAGIPLIVTPFVHPHQWGDGPHEIAFYEKADAVIGLSDTDRDYLLEIGVPKARAHVIGVSPDLPGQADAAAFRQEHKLGDAPVVLYLGRLMPQKGASFLREATPLVWEKYPDARFVFAGPGSEAERAQFDNADARILYLGPVREKIHAMAACDIFCLPSMSEIQPTVYLEAWSLGKPVVGGMAHGLFEMVTGQDAGINVPQEPHAIADALIALLDNPQERARLGANGKRLIQQKHSITAVTDKLLNLYTQTIAKKPNSTNNLHETDTKVQG